MRTREQFSEFIKENIPEITHYYYQTPGNTKMIFPCIVYDRENYNDREANNKKYISYSRYSLELITNTVSDELVEKIRNLKLCSFDRHFINDNLHHYNFTIYY